MLWRSGRWGAAVETAVMTKLGLKIGDVDVIERVDHEVGDRVDIAERDLIEGDRLLPGAAQLLVG